ncbi:MAG: hypothetical protein Q8Q06_02830 [bacterium]|nr:hypothetical protein [bacterium]
MQKPEKIYHGSSEKINGALKPALNHTTLEHVHDAPAVFGTDRIDVSALFMFPMNALASIGFEQDIAYICIWGVPEEFSQKDKGGYIYVLPTETFEKVGKDYEWQSFVEVTPTEIKEFGSVIDGMLECGVQVYFINDENTMDSIVAQKDNRAPILPSLTSENQKRNINIKHFAINKAP